MGGRHPPLDPAVRTPRPLTRSALDADATLAGARPKSHAIPWTGKTMTAAQTLTAAEVAALSGLDEGRVRKEVEYGIFARPIFTFADLVYFAVLSTLGLQLGVDDRRKLHVVVAAAMGARRRPPRVEISPVLEVRLDRVAKAAQGQLDRFEAWKKKRIVSDDEILGGEPTFPESRLAVRHVGGMLLRGASEAEVREDYPYLKDEDLAFATIYTRAYPRMGRPRDAQAPA
jgi:uncharacterized protein (DUF433 family)